MKIIKNKEKKNILFYCPFINRGGIETTLIKYANFLSKFYAVSIFTNSYSQSVLSKINKKIKINNLKNKLYLKSRLINDYMVFKNLSKELDKNTVIFSLQDHYLILILNYLFFKSKIIIRTSSIIPNRKNYLEQKHLKNIFIKKYFLDIYRFADKVITFSKDNVKIFRTKNINSICIYNYFKKQKIFKIIKNKKLNIFFIGRFSFDKDPKFFLRNLLKIENINIHLIGDGIEKNELKKIANKKKNVFFHKFMDKPFEKFKSKIHLLCITSKYDGTPNVMGEAMSFGIPILAPKYIGLTKFFLKNGKYGYLYNNESDLSFKKKIFEILNGYDDAKKKAKLGYESLYRFNKKNTLYKILNVVKKL